MFAPLHALLLQVPITLPADLIFRILEGLVSVIVGWGAIEARATKRQLVSFGEEFAKWRTAMLGIDGTSGLNGDVQALGRRAYLWDKQLGDHETRLVVLESSRRRAHDGHPFQEDGLG